MGERKLAPVQALKAVASASREAIETMVETTDESMRVRTPAGVFSVRWDEREAAPQLWANWPSLPSTWRQRGCSSAGSAVAL